MFNVALRGPPSLESLSISPSFFKNFLHRGAMTSSGGGIGSTLTGGIQDIAAILPLLGTEQCSVQVSSALTRGCSNTYVYIRKFRDVQCGFQDIGCLLLIILKEQRYHLKSTRMLWKKTKRSSTSLSSSVLLIVMSPGFRLQFVIYHGWLPYLSTR